MKKIFLKGVLLLSAAICSISCSLDEYPYGFYSDDNFYQTEADAYSALYYAYATFTDTEFMYGIFYIGECSTETTYLKSGEDSSQPGSQALDEWTTHQSSSNTVLEVFYKYCYIAINRANAVIANVTDSEYLTEEVENEILAQAYFIRAYAHFYLTKVYGLVPMHDAMITTADQASAPAASSMDEMYNFIISDLETSSSLFASYQMNPGLTNKAAAEGLLAKVYLTAASSKESGVPYYTAMSASSDEMYTKAAEWSKKVLDASLDGSCPFALASTLSEIYDMDTTENSCENVFFASTDRTGAWGDYSGLIMYFTPNNGGTAYYVYTPDGVLNSAYFGYEVFQTEDDFYASYDASDLRKSNMMTNHIYESDGTEIGTSADFPFTLKYIDKYHSGEKSSARPFLLRFSDIALTYAEAVGNDNDGWVAQIRARAGLEPLETTSSVDEFRDLIVQERAWEFAFEADRLYDLRRKNMVKEVVSEAADQDITDEQAAFFPIPQTELDLNIYL